MRQRRNGAVTPQRKIAAVSKKFNNPGIIKQQGSTRVIYDTLPVDGRTEFRFFEESNNRNFPETNMGADGNKFPVGYAMVVERYYLTIMEKDPVSGSFITILSLEGSGWIEGQLGELTLDIANSKKIIRVPNLSANPVYNKNACHTAYNNFEFDTQVVIQQLFEFVMKYRVPSYTPLVDTFMRMTVEGVGAIISPRANM